MERFPLNWEMSINRSFQFDNRDFPIQPRANHIFRIHYKLMVIKITQKNQYRFLNLLFRNKLLYHFLLMTILHDIRSIYIEIF